jgi:uncharacterized protein (UPF0332 family)
MAFHDDLLEQARVLARLDKRRPKQANLRRAVSAAYYALFHLLTNEGARKITPAGPQRLLSQVSRAFEHATMRHVCKSLLAPNSALVTAFHLRPTDDLRAVAEAFNSLQDARHTADYDLSSNLDRDDAVLNIRLAESAFAAWHRVRASDEANVFLVALLMKKEWPRR